MVFLSALIHLSDTQDVEPNDLLAAARQRMGHVGLTIIALVFVLVTFWQY